ncbi:MAG: helix-turn-helix transcriptional regulator [Bacteroidota bacterium]
MNIIQLGNVIRENRQSKYISQEKLSLLSEVAIKSIHSIELGKGNPSIKTLTKLLQVLDLELIIVTKKL